MRIRSLLPILSAVVIGVLGAQTKPTIKHVHLSPTSPSSGREMFATYCAVCHGPEGKGGGPAAVALKKQPTDLTRLALNNGGKYPEFLVLETLKGRAVEAHGSQEMPIWGDLFKSLGTGEKNMIELRIVNLNWYVESLQGR